MCHQSALPERAEELRGDVEAVLRVKHGGIARVG